ncbi:MAG: DNA translocase FtsK, partial [Clostridia bacterium]|nr:DNA translocase FtsK [Clostridia bacterium]
VSTVYLRELVDTESFRAASSKLNVCLGMDVAGQAVYLDIAKMPHLLIAGATGMGKSVCINSIITSLLYKASPDDVRMILIDPKKVEFNLYKSLPHLLVPVVSDPKKAAGSLQWAVTEMERRFELIEGAGVRDIKMYNTVTADDPNKEHMTQIVIIIDELADLMMTAPDDVENSICRIAQKARAAGMHLIIGTQRPSVDVVTGLIKANVPSRIAFTVASITDSRVILDMGGAEKLIGRGDMLYAPVGASKPRRVQGAFVSESEVEAVVNFIKDENAEEVEYGSDIVDAIERAAASIGNKKGSASASAVSDSSDDEESDPMLRQAIELAVDSGKISTSLIQRKLSLGYGRAAKLIDKMENMGIVSPPEGQKPRDVLISRQQYIEMFVASGDDL